MKLPFSVKDDRVFDADGVEIISGWDDGSVNDDHGELEFLVHAGNCHADLLAAGKELLALMDSVEIDQRLGDETDRVFPRYEFDGLRAAIAKAEARP